MKITGGTLVDRTMPVRNPVFVSTSVYALGRELGMEAALAEVQRQLDTPGKDSLPVVRTIHRLRQLADVRLHVDCGATCIGKSRSRAFFEAFESGLESWISLDDDIEVTTDTAASLVQALDEAMPRIVVVPFFIRGPNDGTRVNVEMPTVRIEREFRGAKLLKLHGRHHGFAMVGMNRLAMHDVVEANLGMYWSDDDGKPKLALFHDTFEDGFWYGEDMSFFLRVPDTVSIEALLVGTSLHGGLPLDLGKL